MAFHQTGDRNLDPNPLRLTGDNRHLKLFPVRLLLQISSQSIELPGGSLVAKFTMWTSHLNQGQAQVTRASNQTHKVGRLPSKSWRWRNWVDNPTRDPNSRIKIIGSRILIIQSILWCTIGGVPYVKNAIWIQSRSFGPLVHWWLGLVNGAWKIKPTNQRLLARKRKLFHTKTGVMWPSGRVSVCIQRITTCECIRPRVGPCLLIGRSRASSIILALHILPLPLHFYHPSQCQHTHTHER